MKDITVETTDENEKTIRVFNEKIEDYFDCDPDMIEDIEKTELDTLELVITLNTEKKEVYWGLFGPEYSLDFQEDNYEGVMEWILKNKFNINEGKMETKTTKEYGFLVINPEGHVKFKDLYSHSEREDAEKEAERLSNNNSGTYFYVIEIHSRTLTM